MTLHRLVQDNIDLLPSAVNEGMRYDIPAYQSFRRATRDVDYYGVTIANFDPKVNPEPMKFDVTRKKIYSLPFSAAPHTCPGAFLAKTELTVLWVSMN